MAKNILVERAYPARKLRESAPRTPPRLSRGPAFTVITLLSLGLWWTIWIAVSALVSS
jgi:hypothetical protein